MRIFLISLFFIGLSLTHTSAHWSESCPLQKENIPYRCQQQGQSAFTIEDTLQNLSLEMTSLLQAEVDEEKDLFRYMRGLKGDPSTPELEEDFQKRRKSFDRLAAIVEEENISAKKLQVCYLSHCSAARKLELEDQVKYLKKLKIYTLATHPKLAQSAVNELFQIEPPYSDKQIKEALRDSSQEYLLTRKNVMSKASMFRTKLLLGANPNPYDIDPQVGEVLFQSIQKVLNKGSISEDSLPLLCQLNAQRSEYYRNQQIKDFTVEAGLFVAPFLIPPLNFMRVGRLAYLGSIGVRSDKVLVMTEALLARSVEASGLGYLLYESYQKCEDQRIQKNLSHTEEQIESYQECLKEYHDQEYETLLMGGISLMPLEKLVKLAPMDFKSVFTTNYPSLNRSVSQQEGRNFVSRMLTTGSSATYKTDREDYMTVLDLSRLKNTDDSPYKTITSDYWEFVGETYQKRLRLSDEEIKGFLKSSQDFEDRTMIVMRTKDHPANGPPEFKGGMGIVYSDKAEDLLPLEKATGFKIPREGGEEAVEVVRLVVEDPDNPKAMQELKNQMGQLLLENRNTSSFYVYTSQSHERLYRKLGIPYEVIHKTTPTKVEGKKVRKDVIMKFDISNSTIED